MNKFWKTVFLTGMFVGTTDLISAYVTQWISTGKFADRMLLYIGGGLLGFPSSMQGGNWVALVGLLIHYFIATSFTLFFFLIYPRLKFLSFNKYFIGMMYAVFVNVVMSQLILPLTPLPHGAFNLGGALVGWYTLGVVLGIPIAYNAYKYYGVGK